MNNYTQKQKQFLGEFLLQDKLQDKLSLTEFDYGYENTYGYPYINFMATSEQHAKRKAAVDLGVRVEKISCVDGEIFLEIESEDFVETKKILIGEYKIISHEDRRYLIMEH